jgi:hypothetical protein
VVLDEHSKTTQKIRLQRNQKYDDELQHYDRPQPTNAPKWSYIEQVGMIFDTDVEIEPPNEDHTEEEEIERGQTSATGGNKSGQTSATGGNKSGETSAPGGNKSRSE